MTTACRVVPELEQMPLPTAKAIEIVAFVPAASIDPVRLSGDSYSLQYDGQVAAKPYALIARALAKQREGGCREAGVARA
ncbi:Ku protein [Streptomyces mirabilis]|uniref:Ku protein n=1 Tax=Streptomyces mirabilis TaxID=68239 RepID=UPI0036AD3045